MGTMQRRNRIRKELHGRAPLKVVTLPFRKLRRALHDFAVIAACPQHPKHSLIHRMIRDCGPT